MTKTYLNKVLSGLTAAKPKRQLVIRIDTNDYQKGMEKARLLVERLERQMRIQKLEIAVKKMNISRSWV
jgi:hypothetical protein